MRRTAPVLAVMLLVAAPAVGAEPSRPALDLASAEVVDLSHSYDASTVYWPTDTKGFWLEPLHFGPTPAGFFYAANSFSTAEHGGTHLDAPIHFGAGRNSVEAIALDRLVAPAVVIDVTAQAAADPDYRLTVADVEAFEAKRGVIATGTIVLLRTGWSERWPDRKRYLGDDTPADASKLHFPAFGAEAARLLVHDRLVAALGLDTASLDHGPSKDFPVHRIVAAANLPGFENLTHLDRLPATGAWVAALPMKIAGGSGAPLRAIAFVPPRGIAEIEALPPPAFEEAPELLCEEYHRKAAAEVPAASDIRWFDERSLLLAREGSGMRIHAVSPGLPDRMPEEPSLLAEYGCGASTGLSDEIVACIEYDGSGIWNWRAPPEGMAAARFRYAWNVISDFDVFGDEGYLIGSSWRPRNPGGHAGVYRSVATEAPGDFELIYAFARASEQEEMRRHEYLGLRAGLLRVSERGSIFVHPAFAEELLRLDSSGKLKEIVNLEALRIGGPEADRLAAEVNQLHRPEGWYSMGTRVDELLLFGETPALVVRRNPPGKPSAWYLVVIDGPSATTHRIPSKSLRRASRLKGDVSPRGRIAFLVSPVGDRGQEAVEDLVLVCRLP